jgi:hypothetical protein
MTYTSPNGNTYEVTTEVLTRTDYATFGDPNSAFQTEYTLHSVYFEGKLVQFCFTEGEVPAAVARFEHPVNGIGSRWD